MKKEEPKLNRAQRRDLDSINAKFEELMNGYLHMRAVLGNTDTVKNYRNACEKKWRNFCAKHNSNRRHQMKAELEAFSKQLKGKIDLEQQMAASIHKQSRDKIYNKWVRIMALTRPRLLWKWKQINRIKKIDYVKAKYNQYEGKAPGGRWV